MLILRMLMILTFCAVVDVRFVLYHSNNDQTLSPFFDCLYASWVDDKPYASWVDNEPYSRNYYLVPYCRRPDDGDEEEEEEEKLAHISYVNVAQKVSFNQLKQDSVTSEQLIAWSVPIDIAEQYEIGSGNLKGDFYNCSSPWFGAMCQYKFDDDSPPAFNEIVQATFTNRSDNSVNITTGTCYRFIDNCDRGPWPLCLDWREICDGKADCFNGDDEQMCEELEINQCNDDEYRCHNGQCISSAFAREGLLYNDCLDGSDELDVSTRDPYSIYTINHHCFNIPTFRCEERTNRYFHHFSCGDGEYHRESLIPATVTYCQNNRDKEMNRVMLTSLNYIENIRCRQVFYCALHANRSFGHRGGGGVRIPLPIFEGEWDKDCEPLNESCSSEWLVFPEKPIMFSFFQFVYLTNRSVDEFKEDIQPDFVCFNAKRCPVLSCDIIHIELINGLKCCRTSNLTSTEVAEDFNRLESSFFDIFKNCLTTGQELSCTDSSKFHCNQSLKCISFHRVRDGVVDCLHGEDELFPTCSMNDTNRFPCKSDQDNCLSPVAIGNGFYDCFDRSDEGIRSKEDFNKTQLYSTICNDWAAQDFLGRTDADDCEWWPCDNAYVHCDKIWDCPNGVDELNCPHTTCSFNEHRCKNDDLKLSYCLPINQIADKYIPECYEFPSRMLYFTNGSITNDEEYYLWNTTKCITADKVFRGQLPIPSIAQENICLQENLLPQLSVKHSIMLLDTEIEYCKLEIDTGFIWDRMKHFLTPFRFGDFPPKSSSNPVGHVPTVTKNKGIVFRMNFSRTWFCHRGILVLYGTNQTKKCLCPPSYFGFQCQWQSQRVSLTIQFISPRTVVTTHAYQIIVMLINEQEQIVSNHEQISFIPARDCGTKFNLYLLYPHRPKNNSNNYSIRIDLFDKITLDFWASWHLAIPFQFLPVNRISTQLLIPKVRETESYSISCGNHGRCVRYTNKKSLFYCQCNPGYSGSFCNLTHSCQCSQGSICLAPTVCVCPINKFGSYCYLNRSICQPNNNPCRHNGLCIPNDDRIDSQSFTCFCKEGYFGRICEHFSNRIDIILDDTITLTSTFVFVHFVTAFDNSKHELTTIFKKTPIVRNSITLYRSQPFHIIFVQLHNQSYYLTILRETFIPTENIRSEVLMKQHCWNITDLVNSTIIDYEEKKRVRLYPFICRQYPQLSCFYDKIRMCICDLDRFANCFLFNHTLNNDCQGYNDCENEGQCFLNNQTCPTASVCICQDCFHGGKCQFSTNSHLISLDGILGYYITPNMTLSEQSSIVKVSMTITIVLFFCSLINGLLSILTFRTKKSKEVGCGYYLLTSSITSILMMCVLVVKFVHLLLSQMEIITNRSILLINCKLLDVLLKILLASNEWFIACVAIERLYSASRGVSFDKKKSKQVAKWIIPIVFLLIILSLIHDPIHRHLIDDLDGDQLRTWCFVRFSSSISIYNSSITLIHFLGPFSIHCISALVVIKIVVRTHSTVKHDQSLKQQLYRHKHLFYTPAMLILFCMPRLIITFTTGCMRTLRHPWLNLIGYYISFSPSILIFITFVLPSKNYRNEFQLAIQEQLRRFRRH